MHIVIWERHFDAKIDKKQSTYWSQNANKNRTTHTWKTTIKTLKSNRTQTKTYKNNNLDDRIERRNYYSYSFSSTAHGLLNSWPRSWIHLFDTHLIPARTGQAACLVVMSPSPLAIKLNQKTASFWQKNLYR